MREQGRSDMWMNLEERQIGVVICSFCKKREDQVQRLTAGPGGVHICNECVDLYREHLAKTAGEYRTMATISHTCSTCGTRAPVSHRYCYNCGSPLNIQQKSDS